MTVMDMLMLALAAGGAGFIAGLLGVGGGIVLVPSLLFFQGELGFPPAMAMHMALATSLATVVPISITSAWSHYRRDNVEKTIWQRWVFFVALGAIIGGFAVRWFDSRTLEILFSFLAFGVAINLLRPRPWVVWQAPPGGWVWNRVTPTLIGGLGALFGIGGGTFNVPYLCAMSVPIRQAIGTAASLGVILSVPGAIGFVISGLGRPELPAGSAGFIHLGAVAIMAPLAVLMAPVGAKVTSLMPVRPLQIVFAGFVAVVAFRLIF